MHAMPEGFKKRRGGETDFFAQLTEAKFIFIVFDKRNIKRQQPLGFYAVRVGPLMVQVNSARNFAHTCHVFCSAR
jgi:hypothetical protein